MAQSPRTAGLLLVLAEGPVKQAILTLEQPATQEQLNAAARALNSRLVGCSARMVERRLEEFAADDVAARVVRRAAERVARLMRDFDAEAVEEVFSEGLLNVMDAPEFAQSQKLRRVFGVLQDRDYLGGLVHEVARRGDVQVFIGSENAPYEMHDVSLILAPYGRTGRATGVVGVLGPTRLAYPHAISTVRYVSGLMNELVDHLYA